MQQNSVRIIGGKWRGRRVQFAEVIGLRPTPDRVRETLFNWLQGLTAGAHCLDLFAGSGVLGFEALSRGAQSAVMVDTQLTVIHQLQVQATLLGTQDVELVESDALAYLRQCKQQFDLVFVDPPYQTHQLRVVCEQLAQRDVLADSAYIFLESHHAESEFRLPVDWQDVHDKRAGQVRYRLTRRTVR